MELRGTLIIKEQREENMHTKENELTRDGKELERQLKHQAEEDTFQG